MGGTARSLIRDVRSGVMDRRLSTMYSNRLMPDSRCSWASSAPGSCTMRLATAIHARCSSSESQRGAAAAAVQVERAAMPQAYEASGFISRLTSRLKSRILISTLK
jgi:hypothetical protein